MKSQPKFYIGDKVKIIQSRIPPDVEIMRTQRERLMQNGEIVQIIMATKSNTGTGLQPFFMGNWAYCVLDVTSGVSCKTWYIEDWIELDVAA